MPQQQLKTVSRRSSSSKTQQLHYTQVNLPSKDEIDHMPSPEVRARNHLELMEYRWKRTRRIKVSGETKTDKHKAFLLVS